MTLYLAVFCAVLFGIVDILRRGELYRIVEAALWPVYAPDLSAITP